MASVWVAHQSFLCIHEKKLDLQSSPLLSSLELMKSVFIAYLASDSWCPDSRLYPLGPGIMPGLQWPMTQTRGPEEALGPDLKIAVKQWHYLRSNGLNPLLLGEAHKSG